MSAPRATPVISCRVRGHHFKAREPAGGTKYRDADVEPATTPDEVKDLHRPLGLSVPFPEPAYSCVMERF